MNTKERFTDIILDGVLPTGVRLVTDKKHSSLLLMKGETLHEQEVFTPNEYRILILLCEAFPRGCKYEKLLGAIKGVDEKEALGMLKDAMQVGGNEGFEGVLKSVRTMISRLRVKLAPLKVGILNDKEGLYALGMFDRRASFHERIRAEIISEEEST